MKSGKKAPSITSYRAYGAPSDMDEVTFLEQFSASIVPSTAPSAESAPSRPELRTKCIVPMIDVVKRKPQIFYAEVSAHNVESSLSSKGRVRRIRKDHL